MAAADDIRRLNEEIASLSRKLGKGTLKIFEPGELREAEAAVRGLRAELSDMEGSATNLYEQLRGVTSELKGQETATQGVRKAFRSITADANKLKLDEQEIEKLSSKQLETLQKRVKANKEKIDSTSRELIGSNRLASRLDQIVQSELARNKSADEINRKVAQHLSRINTLSDEQKAILASYFDQNNVVDEILEKTKQRLDFEKEIDKKVRGFTALADLAGSIPGLRKFAGPFKEAEKSARLAAEAGKGFTGILKAGAGGLAKAFGPVSIALSAIKFLVDLLFTVDKQVTEIGKAQALSATEANAFREEIQAAGIYNTDLVNTTKNLLESQTQLSQAAGATRGFKIDELKAQTMLTQRVGIQAETAAKLANLSRVQGETSEDALDSIIKSTVALQRQTGIQLDNRDVLNEVANTQGQLSANYKNSPRLIAQAVTQVRKLGLNLQQARDASSKLLDFESSISAELEAELLTGRSLNLERARALALQGKSAEAAEELAKNFGSLEEFQNMNVLQQRALADAVGLTTDELANSLLQQENLAKLGAQTREEVKKRADELRAAGKVEEANRLISQAANEEDAKAALLRLDSQQKFNAAIEKAKDIFSSLIDSLPMLKGLLAAAAVILAGMAISAIATASAATLGIGAIAIGAGIATAAAAYKSAKKQSTQSADDAVISPQGGLMVSGPEGSISLNKKDSIVAGTDLFGGNSQSTGGGDKLDTVIARLNSLIEVVKQGGDVFMDGAKVGRATVLAGTNLS